MIDSVVLQTGAEIPFPQGKLIIHPPNLYEIGWLFFINIVSFLSFLLSFWVFFVKGC